MAIFDFFLSRNNAVSTPENYVGHAGRLFYDSDTGEIKISDGVTAGGLPIPITLATSTLAGGIKLGPGVVLNGSGQIIIDSEGLDFSFGDLASTTETYPVGHPQAGDDYAVLSTINTDEDLYLVSNGEGSIDVIGEFNVYKTDGNVAGAIAIDPIFTVKSDGQIRMLVPGADSNEGALNIIGGLDAVFQAPVNTGVMLHITGIAGDPGVPSRVYNDSQNAFSAFVARRYNNTAASPTTVLDGEEIMRLSGTAHNGTIIPGTANQRIVYRALGNQTPSNQGGNIELWTTPLNSITLAKVATVDSTGISLESGKVLTGNVTGTSGHFTNINANVAAANAAIITANTAMKSYVDAVTTAWTANAATQQVQINSLATGANANTAAYLTTATGNISAGNLSIGTSGRITTPKVVINDSGIRTISGGTTCTIDFNTDSIILWTAPSGTAAITLSNYTPGATVKLIIAMTTSRDITFGISSAANSSTGADNWNGAGGGAVDISNTAVQLEYTCISAVAGGCYVAVIAN